jgi:hypothetical protein
MTENIMDSGLFDVKAIAEFDGTNYENTTTVSYCAAGRSTGA